MAIFFPPLCLEAAFPPLHLKAVVLQQFHSPTCIVAAPDGSGRLFVCDQPGHIYIVEGGMMRPEPFLDISNTASNVSHRKVLGLTTGYNERGLLSLAFHPDFGDEEKAGFRRFYVNYIKAYEPGVDPPPHDGGGWTPNATTVISEFQVSAEDVNSADPLSERKLLLFPQPQSNHNGGNLVFDAAGLLYIGSGDGGSANDNNTGHTGGGTGRPTDALGNSQDRTNFLGKILRIDPLGNDGPGGQYGIPATNPFAAEGGGVKKEIYAYGIRNPWGMSFDSGPGGTGRLFCADVGQGRIEEVNLIVSGGNYGWRYMEGDERPVFSSSMSHPGAVLLAPIAQYGHVGITGTAFPLLGLSITGGGVYRGGAIPALQGKYVFGDYGSTNGSASGRLMGLEETVPGGGVFTLTEALPILGGNPLSTRVMCLGCDSEGEIYVGTKSSGGVLALENGLPNGGLYKLVEVPSNPPPAVFTAVADTAIFSDFGAGGEELSNGQGALSMGTAVSGDLRRMLLKFDLSTVPAGARFSGAWLRVHVEAAETPPGSVQRNTFVNRLLNPWGEAGSLSASGGAVAEDGDATWFNAFYSASSPVPWASPGADFDPTVSAGYGVDSRTGPRGFFGPRLTEDVRQWLASPASNHGWILRSDEGAASTTKTVASREDPDAAKRPQLTLVFATAFENWLAQHFPGNLQGQWVDPRGDLDGDGVVNLIEYAFGRSPLAADATPGVTTAVSPLAAGSRQVNATFLRDTQATDLTYRFQISGDLVGWTTVAVSLGGAEASGLNGGIVTSETPVSGTVNEVAVSIPLSGLAAEKQFVRLAVDREP